MGEMRAKALNNIVSKEIVREVQMETLRIISKSLKNSYGPNGSTTEIRSIIDKNDTGRTDYTKDGHKILGAIKFNKPIELSIVDDLRNITRNTIKNIGDGTTSSIILSDLLFEELYNYCSTFNVSEKEILNEIKTVADSVCSIIESNKQDVDLDKIYDIAYTSTDGDKDIAKHIKDIYQEFGNSVYIDVGVSNTEKSLIKSYDGLTIDSGYFNPNFINNTKNSTCEIRDPKIYIFEDPIDTPEMLSLLGHIITDNIITPLRNRHNKDNKNYDINSTSEMETPTVILAPKYSNDIRNEIDTVINTLGSFTPANRPKLLMVTNITRIDYLYDLARLSGAKLIKKYIDTEIQKEDIQKGLAPTTKTIHKFAGSADLVISDVKSTKFINPSLMFDENGNKSEVFKNLVDSLKAELHKLEEDKTEVAQLNRLRRRIKSIECNMVDYLVGGISYTDRDAKKDLVEDAVLNCRSAAENGIGFGANFEALRACTAIYSELSKSKVSYIYGKDIKLDAAKILLDSYRKLFKMIYDNGNTISESDLDDIIEESIRYKCPLNIRTNEYDNKVLSSIKADIVILNTIINIIGLMFKTNQYLLPDPVYNTYDY